MRLMCHPVQDGARDHGIGKNIHPVGHGAIAGEDDRASAVPGVNNAVEKLAIFLINFLKREIIDDEQITVDEFFEETIDGAVAVGAQELGEQLVKFIEQHAVSFAASFVANGLC